MSGRRCKALRAGFALANGRAPQLTRYDDVGGYWTSEWRRLKKLYKFAKVAK